MNCCNDFGQCTQGHGCPARTTRQYTCAELGVCNCPGPNCLQAAQDAPYKQTPFDQIAYWGTVIVTSCLTVASTAGVAGYLYAHLFS